jgi:hypothetical protein
MSDSVEGWDFHLLCCYIQVFAFRDWRKPYNVTCTRFVWALNLTICIVGRQSPPEWTQGSAPLEWMEAVVTGPISWAEWSGWTGSDGCISTRFWRHPVSLHHGTLPHGISAPSWPAQATGTRHWLLGKLNWGTGAEYCSRSPVWCSETGWIQWVTPAFYFEWVAVK